MFCQRCGTQLSDDAQFCMRCGQPQGQASSASSQQWEKCTIGWSTKNQIPSFESWCFWGEAISPKDTYSAGEVVVRGAGGPEANNRRHIAACEELKQQLISKDWELTGEKGAYWWQYKFRRPFQPWDYCTIEWDRVAGGTIAFGNNRWCFMAKSTVRDASTTITKAVYDSRGRGKSFVRVAATVFCKIKVGH